MYSCCNLSLCSEEIILIVNLNCIESNFDFYISAIVRKRPFFIRITIGNANVSSYVIMVDYVIEFQSNRVNFVSSRRFLIADYVIY